MASVTLASMNTAAQTGNLRLVLHAVQAATEFVLAPVWGAALLFGLLVAHGPHGHDRMFLTLLWAVLETRPFLLCGLALFFGAWGLHRAGWPLWLIRIAGGLAASALALLIARRSFYRLLDQPGYYFLAPLIFLGLFVLCALFYGASLLPRHFSPQARPRLHLHWLVLAMFLPYVSWFVLRAASPAPGPWLPPLTTPVPSTFRLALAGASFRRRPGRPNPWCACTSRKESPTSRASSWIRATARRAATKRATSGSGDTAGMAVPTAFHAIPLLGRTKSWPEVGSRSIRTATAAGAMLHSREAKPCNASQD